MPPAGAGLPRRTRNDTESLSPRVWSLGRMMPPPPRLVSVKVAVATKGNADIGTEAVTVNVPAVPLAVRVGAVAKPAPFVGTIVKPVNVPPAPATGFTVNVTVAPGTALPLPKGPSVTLTVNAAGNGLPNPVLCGVPPTVTIDAGDPVVVDAVLVRAKNAVPIPAANAVTTYDPAVPLAVNVIAAMPFGSVRTVVGPENVPLAPVEGAVNVTGTDLIPTP